MKYVIFTISLLAFVSCKDSKNKDINTETIEQSADIHNDHNDLEASNIYSNAWTSEMKLNDGIKWQANAETNEGIVKMQNNIKSYTTSTLDEYHQLAEQLNVDKNYVVNNCTMKGASHDNLHIWLLPLMKKIKALSEAKTIDEAVKLKQSIEENINAYSDYFE